MNITEIMTGIPQNKESEIPLMKQFVVDRVGKIKSGLAVYDDGDMFMASRINDTGQYKWVEFTRLKKDGIELLQKLIENEFPPLENLDIQTESSESVLIWIVKLNGKEKEIRVASGSYYNLPSVFEKVDRLINKYMYRMNEKIEH